MDGRTKIIAGRALTVVSIAAIVIGLSGGALAQGKAYKRVRDGNKLFSEGKLDEANNAYRDAQLEAPTSPIIKYDIANTEHEKKKYEEAVKLLDDVTRSTDDVALQARAYYNIGNSLYRLNKLPESILAYKEALKLNPNDEDAKYNLEYVRAKLKQQAQKQQPQQNQQNSQQQNKPDQGADQHEQQQQGDEKQQQEQQEQQQEGQQKDQAKNKSGQAEQDQQAQEQQARPKELSKEEAERILNALQNEEKDVQKGKKIKGTGRKISGKDW